MASERKAFRVLAATTWTYVALRAAFVPWIHDEAASILWFAERGEFLPYRSLWDAGNHWLSSAFGVLAYKLVGLSLPLSRIGSVLAFPIYAWAVWRLAGRLRHGPVRISAWSALLLCPFLLDFFSLFRGYALQMAFWAVALDGGIRWLSGQRPRHLLQMLIGLVLAAFSVLSILPAWAFLVAMVPPVLLLRWRASRAPTDAGGALRPITRFAWRQLALWFFFGVMPLLVGLLLSWEMRRRGLLYHGSLEGFGAVTIDSLSQLVLGGSGRLVRAAVVAVVVLASLPALLPRLRATPLAWMALLLWAEVVMRIVMATLLGVNYAEDRAALHLVPLVLLLLAFALDALAGRRSWLQWSALLLLFLPLRTVVNANLDHTLLWPEQSVPPRFLHQVALEQARSDRPLVLGAYHQLHLNIPYGAKLHGLEMRPPDVYGFPEGPHDLRIVDERFIARAREGYVELDHSPGNGLYLLRRAAPLRWEQLMHVPFVQLAGVPEFIDLWEDEGEFAGQELLLEVGADLASEASYLELNLVLSADSLGESLLYTAIPAAMQRPQWNGERYRVAVRIPVVPGATTRKVYLWNTGAAPLNIANGEIRLHRLLP